MPNSYPHDGIFNPHHTTIKDSYIIPGTVSKTDVQQRYLQTAPASYSFQSHLAYLSERMRKRRCFADKHLDTAMFPKESFQMDIRGRFGDGHCIGITEWEYQVNLLKKMFPNLNENVLELIWRAHGCSLEKAIEHVTQTVSLGRNLTNILPKMMHRSSSVQNRTLFEKTQTEKTELGGKFSTSTTVMSNRLEPGERAKTEMKQHSQSSECLYKRGLSIHYTTPSNNGIQVHTAIDRDEKKGKAETCSSKHSLLKPEHGISAKSKKTLSFSIDVILS